MAFEKKEWKDRITEYPNRRTLTDVATNESQTVLVERNEGAVSAEGDAFSAETMNDLEQRIGDAFSEVNSSLSELGGNIRYDIETDTIQIYNGSSWIGWRKAGLSQYNLLTLNRPSDWFSAAAGSATLKFTAGENHLQFNCTEIPGTGVVYGYFLTENKIDLNLYTTLEYTVTGSYDNTARIALFNSKTASNSSIVYSKDLPTNGTVGVLSGTQSIDVSAYNDDYYIGVYFGSYSQRSRLIKFSKLILT